MSHALQAFILQSDSIGKDNVFAAVENLFDNPKGLAFTRQVNPLTEEEKLRITVDDVYNVSVFFEEDDTEDFNAISNKEVGVVSSIRILFGPDPENDFDDIGVILLDYLESFEQVLIYSLNREEIISDSL